MRDWLSMFAASPPADVFREYDVRGLVDAPFDVDPDRLNEYSAIRLERAFGA